IIHGVDRSRLQWHRLPVFLGLMYLAARRHLHYHYSLLFVGKVPATVRFNPADFPYRTPDGKFNDPSDEVAGSSESFFGRNMLPIVDKKKFLATMLIQIAIALLTPNPMVVATKLLARKQFIDTGKQLNLIAASWIQFMIHEWIDHLESSQEMELKASEEVANQCPLQSFKFYKTKKVKTGLDNINKGHLNIRTSWWDGSAIYGSNSSQLHQVRTYKEGKLKIANDGLLHHDENGLPITGDIRNGWIGVSTLQALFILEHNAVCDTLKKEYPDMNDETIFRHARLVTSAVIAKIHTIDWTVQLLKTDTLHAGMRANWYGLFGKKFKDRYGHVGGPFYSGLVGLEKPNNYGVPYSLTEEFACVYRMHSLVPDQLLIRDINSPPGPNKSPMLRNK
ncbi:alpha-dioxygenase 1-like protein, partial [Tanacetum coccineum]